MRAALVEAPFDEVAATEPAEREPPAGLSARATISRKEFGVSWGPLLETGGVAVGDKVKLELEAQAVLGE